jgi:NADPH:quinone reductase-like Zn-dependent oxidoreductase
MTTNSISRNGSMTMKAVRLVERGGAEKVMYTEAPRPHIEAGEALVRICASAITPTELTWSSTWTTKSGQDRLPSTLGHEFAGFVEDLAPDVNDVRIGDAVYALSDFWRDGSEAEYLAVKAADLAPKPRSLDFASAAAVPLAALTVAGALHTRWTEKGTASPDPRRRRGSRDLRGPARQMGGGICDRNGIPRERRVSPPAGM